MSLLYCSSQTQEVSQFCQYTSSIMVVVSVPCLFVYVLVCMVVDDFAPSGEKPAQPEKVSLPVGQKRKWLRVYETVPSQVLNGYGASKYFRLEDEGVWKHMNYALKTGAQYMIELCDESPERRGVGINRWLQVLNEYMNHQISTRGRKHNEFVLNPSIFKEVYEDIDKYHASVKALLATKKASRFK